LDVYEAVAADISGFFEFNFIPAGDYYLVAYAGLIDPWAASDPQTITILSDTLSSSFILQLDYPGVTGSVINATDGAPIENAIVEIYNNILPFMRWASTASDGSFNIGGLLPGNTYSLTAWAPYGVDWMPAGPLEIPIASPTATVIYNMHLSVVDGFVVKAGTGAPIPNAYIYATDYNGIWVETWSDASGYFKFTGLPYGDYDIQVLPLDAVHPGQCTSKFIDGPQTHIDRIPSTALANKIVIGEIIDKDTIQASQMPMFRAAPDALGITCYQMPTALTVSIRGDWEVGTNPYWPAPWFPQKTTRPSCFNRDLTPENQDVRFEVLPPDASVTGRIVCPGGVDCLGEPPSWDFWIEVQGDKSFNQAPLDDLYTFNIPLLSGWNRLSVYLGAPDLQGPQDIYFYAPPDSGAYNLGDLELIARDALISGQVALSGGQGLGEIMPAWQRTGGWVGRSPTQQVLHLPVFAGEWHVIANPTFQSYVINGEPVRFAPPQGGLQASIFRPPRQMP
jgi:hypothetical protein